jgi:Carboxypeptidase regulatory-like domain
MVGDRHRARAARILGPPLIVILTVTALGTALWAQGKPGIPIRGVVVGARDGKPREGVTVRLVARHGSPPADALTDAKGAFTLMAPSAGEYYVYAVRSGFERGEYPGDPYATVPQPWLQVSGPMSGLVVKLREGPRVAGAVRDQNDQPVAGAFVQSLRRSVLGGRQILVPGLRTLTGADGAYDLALYDPGTYFIAVLPTHRPMARASSVLYYLDARTASLAAPLELKANETTRTIDFHLRRERGFVISGMLDLAPGRAGVVQILYLYRVSGDSLPVKLEAAHVVLENGRFTFPPVPAGPYEIRFVSYPQLPAAGPRDGMVRSIDQGLLVPERLALVPDGATLWASKRVDLVDDDVAVVLQLQQGVRVSGRVVFTGPAPKPDPSLLRTRGIYLRSVDVPAFHNGPLGPAREDGTFQTVGVPPGRYVLGTYVIGADDPYPGFQLESVRVGGHEVGGMSFELDHDITNAVLTFSAQVTAVTGHVTVTPGGDTFVLIWPQDEAQWNGSGTSLERIYRAVLTGDSYAVHVFPGKYHVAALAGLPPQDWESPEYLRSIAHLSQPVDVVAGQTVVENLDVRSPR